MVSYMEYASLVETLNQWAEAYAKGEPLVEDNVYDRKYLELKEFEMANPAFILANSPTRHVIDGAEGFRKVKHEIPMISIANSNGIDEAVAWVSQMNSEHNVIEFELEYKLDGGGLALIYKDGKLVDAVTRGKDNVGDSVWENALRINGVPHTIDASGIVEVRGEVLWNFDDFDAYNEQMAEQGKKLQANPRNGATGTLKLHDPEEVARRNIRFMAYLLVRGGDGKTQSADIATLTNLGFTCPPSKVVTVAEFRDVAEEMRSHRYELPYAIDGIVVKVNDKDLQKEIGYGTKAPKYFTAYKFPPEEKSTELIDIEQSIGRSGAITPVAIVKPVTLAMTTVQRCSLHNWDVVEYLGLHKGCHVTIRKAGEIIPEIVRCDETGMSKDDYEVLNTGKNAIPKYFETHSGPDFHKRPETCPFCGSVLHNAVNQDGDGLVAWVCDNSDCTAQLVGKLVNFASRQAMNITGLGESIIQELVDAGKVHDITDFYRLTVDDLVGLGNIREKSAGKLVDSFGKSKGNGMHQLIEGMSIAGIGHMASPVLATATAKVGGMGVLCDSEPSVVAEFRRYAVNEGGLTDRIVDDYLGWIGSHGDMVRFLVDNGIAMNVEDKTPVSSKLAGRVCIMTGVFDKLERDVFKEMVVANGGKICSSITKKTNLVLLGDGAGPKKVQAIKELQASGQKIDVITPDELQKFLDMIG